MKNLVCNLDIRSSEYDSRLERLNDGHFINAHMVIHNAQKPETLTITLDGKAFSLKTLEEVISTAKTLLQAQNAIYPQSEITDTKGDWKIVYENGKHWDAVLVKASSREEALETFKSMNIEYTDVTDVEPV